MRGRAISLGLGLAGAALAAAVAQPAAIVDLAGVAPADGIAFWAYGSDGVGSSGLPVAAGGDLDGDGDRDVAVAFITADPLGRTDAGEVNVVFGDGTVSGFVDTAVDGPRLLRIFGDLLRETAGTEVWIDDVTGDGRADLLVCRQNYSPSGARIGAGALTILRGGPELRQLAVDGEPIDLRSPPGEVGITTLVGADSLDRLGIWVRTGDVDGDGTADIVVGADQQDLGAELNRGALWVVRGGPHLDDAGTVDLAQFGATVLSGHLALVTPPPGSSGFHLGATTQVADLDGNARAEVLGAATVLRASAGIVAEGAAIGSAQANGGAPGGAVFIAWDDNFPATPWPASYTIALEAPVGSATSLRGTSVFLHFGEEMVAGDFDDDGAADLFVGDLAADGSAAQNRAQSGLGVVLFAASSLKGLDVDLDLPPPGLVTTFLLGPESGALGADTATAADFDGDGRTDLAFASPHANPLGRIHAGAIHLIFGRQGGWPLEIDLMTGSMPTPEEVLITELRGAHGSTTPPPEEGDTLGYSADAADLDADGRVDLVTNEMVGNGLAPGAVDAGNLIAVSGWVLSPPQMFTDGFESGDTSRWSSAAP